MQSTTAIANRGNKTSKRMPSLVILIPVTLCLVFLCISTMLFKIQDQIILNSAGTFSSSSSTANHHHMLRQPELQGHRQATEYDTSDTTTTNAAALAQEPISDLRKRLPPSIWTVANQRSDPAIAQLVRQKLKQDATEIVNIERGMNLCGTFLYSTIQRAVQVDNMGQHTFVSTGDIPSMWTRDSAVQIGIYYGRMGSMSNITTTTSSQQPQSITGQPYLRLIVEGAIRRQAFNIIQDPYGNAYARHWKSPKSLELKQRVIGRGGWTDTRNYEVDSGAYFFTQLYDFYVAEHLYRPQVLLAEPIIFDAVMLMVQTYIVEQNHDRDSPYRYFELPEGGKGNKTAYTGMTWSGFRPSDDKCQYGYLIPANIHLAAGLERILELNRRIWKSEELQGQATTLLRDIERGIQQYGIVEVPAKSGTGTERLYAYEVDGLGNKLVGFDDANVPSLLSIPLLGWSGYDREVYRNTRARLLDPETNSFYVVGEALRGIGSPHTPKQYVWPLAFAIEALTEEGSPEHIADVMAFQIQQSLKAACRDAMHEGVHADIGCPKLTRGWFEWANAMFVVLMETALGQRCDAHGRQATLRESSEHAIETYQKKPYTGKMFYENHYKNNHTIPDFYQGIEAQVKYRAPDK